jgi:transcriptional regulator GlxA family with amidase domain
MAAATESPPERAGAHRSAPSIERALAHIHRHLGERLPLDDLAHVAGLSVWRFATVFRRHVGQAPHRYICTLRVRRAQALLDAGMPAACVASETGFYDQSHLSRHFKSVCGMTPGQYLAQPRGPRLAA